jgi:hypothetical protein
VLRLLGVTGAPSAQDFTQACRLIREVAIELTKQADDDPEPPLH